MPAATPVMPGTVSGLLPDFVAEVLSARFGGVSQLVDVPISAVLGIYARETGEGMVFREETPPPESLLLRRPRRRD